MRKLKYFYTDEILRHSREDGWYMESNNGLLYSLGKYKTNMTKDDLPESYLEGMFFREHGYLQTSGVVDLVYVPNYHVNHMLRDDFLYISYSEKIKENTDIENHPYEKFTGYDTYVWGGNIINFIKYVDKYSDFDTSKIKEQIEAKKQHFKKNYPDAYKWGVRDSDFWK